MSTAHKLVVLSQRRCGAAAIYSLLAPWVAGAEILGGQPFEWQRPLGEVSRTFHQASRGTARELLDRHLARGVCFHHRHDTESWEFNAMLLEALEAAKYRVVLVDRDVSVSHLLSIAAATRLACATRAEVHACRQQLRDGQEPLPPWEPAELAALVQGHLAGRQWFQSQLDACSLERLVVSYADIFVNGVVSAIGAADALFDFCGIGPRAARIDDASVLRMTLLGNFHTSGLAAYSGALQRARQVIELQLQGFLGGRDAEPRND
jgi:hypothetical protein